jgi:hypothetical protein
MRGASNQEDTAENRRVAPKLPPGRSRRPSEHPLDCRGTCLDARGLSEDQLVEGARRSTLEQLADASLWADKTLAS